MLHISALGIDTSSPSLADRTKAAGESAVREEFPGCVLVRPSLLFGEGDRFFTKLIRLARSPGVIPLIAGGKTRVQPVHVEDLNSALIRLVAAAAPAPLYEIGGPRIYWLREVCGLVFDAVGKPRRRVSLPYPFALVLGGLLGRLPNPPLTAEQARLMRTDKIAAAGSYGLSELGIQPRRLEDWLNLSAPSSSAG